MALKIKFHASKVSMIPSPNCETYDLDKNA